MAALTEATLTNKDNSKSYIFRAMAPIRNKKSQPCISIPLVNTTPENTFLFRFLGQEEEVSFNFGIFDDNSDTSSGTHGSTVKTVDEQIAYLKDNIYTDNFDVDWTFQHDRYAPGAGINCVITNLDFDNKAGGVTLVIGSITLKRGRIGSL